MYVKVIIRFCTISRKYSTLACVNGWLATDGAAVEAVPSECKLCASHSLAVGVEAVIIDEAADVKEEGGALGTG